MLQLLDYELWSNKKNIQTLQETNPPERALQVMGYILSVQRVWFNRIQGDTNQVPVWQDVQIKEMLPKAGHQYQLMKAYLLGVTDGQLVREVSYQSSKGQSFCSTLQDILLQLCGLSSRPSCAIDLPSFSGSPINRLHLLGKR